MFFEKGETMSEEEKKFLEIVDLKKGFGSGETRQEVLRGMNFSVAKGEFFGKINFIKYYRRNRQCRLRLHLDQR